MPPRRRAAPASSSRRKLENRAAIISNIIANLALLHATGPAPGARLAVDMAHSQRTRYDRPGFGLLPRMVDRLESAGLLIKHSAKIRRLRTTIEPSTSLRASFDQGAINLGDIGRAEGEEQIWLTTRTGEMGFAGKPPPKALVHYKDTDETRRLRAEMTEINRFLATANITLADAPQPAGCLTRRFILRTPDDPAAFNLGGRLFGGFWQNLPREERHRLRINGEPVADLDYSGMFPRLAYLAAGAPLPPPDADPYAIPGLEGHRDGAKKALNALLSRSGPMRNLKGDLKALLPPGMTAGKLTAAVNAHHADLAPLFGTDLGIDLMSPKAAFSSPRCSASSESMAFPPCRCTMGSWCRSHARALPPPSCGRKHGASLALTCRLPKSRSLE